MDDEQAGFAEEETVIALSPKQLAVVLAALVVVFLMVRARRAR